jgi:hypothetical protein
MATAKGNGYLLGDVATLASGYTVVATAADDASTTLSIEKPVVVVTGTGVNHWFNTPSAASLTRANFVIRNWSSEFVGVKNSDSTLWLRVAPSQTAVVFLTAGGSAAGTWGAELSPIHPDYGFDNIEDFVWGVASFNNTKSGIYGAASGTGASAVASAISAAGGPTTGTQGQGRIILGTNTDSGAYFAFYNAALVAGQGMPLRFFSDRNYTSILSDGTDNYVWDIGFGDLVTAGDHNDGVWLRHDRSVSETNWVSAVASGGASTIADTSVAIPAATSLFDVNIEIASDSSRADMWVDRVLIATVTGANIPTTGEYFGMVYKSYKVAGTTSLTIYVDRIGIMGAKNKSRGLA